MREQDHNLSLLLCYYSQMRDLERTVAEIHALTAASTATAERIQAEIAELFPCLSDAAHIDTGLRVTELYSLAVQVFADSDIAATFIANHLHWTPQELDSWLRAHLPNNSSLLE